MRMNIFKSKIGIIISCVLLLAVGLGIGYFISNSSNQTKQAELNKLNNEQASEVKKLKEENEKLKKNQSVANPTKLSDELIMKAYLAYSGSSNVNDQQGIAEYKKLIKEGMLSVSKSTDTSATMGGSIGGNWLYFLSNDEVIVVRTGSAGYVTDVSGYSIEKQTINKVYESDFDLSNFTSGSDEE